jgi:hypothetical protein
MLAPKTMNSKFPVKQTCDGIDCYEEATEIIVEKIGALDSITLQLCKECKDRFNVNSVDKLTEMQKKVLDQEVSRPACSNTSSQNQPVQQHEVAIR